MLLVERDHLVREGMSALLRVWNFDVVAGSEPRAVLHAAAGTTAPDLAIVVAPDGAPAIGASWAGELYARYGAVPMVLVADRLNTRVPALNKDCVRIDWPVKADKLRDAIAVVLRSSTAAH